MKTRDRKIEEKIRRRKLRKEKMKQKIGNGLEEINKTIEDDFNSENENIINNEEEYFGE